MKKEQLPLKLLASPDPGWEPDIPLPIYITDRANKRINILEVFVAVRRFCQGRLELIPPRSEVPIDFRWPLPQPEPDEPEDTSEPELTPEEKLDGLVVCQRRLELFQGTDGWRRRFVVWDANEHRAINVAAIAELDLVLCDLNC